MVCKNCIHREVCASMKKHGSCDFFKAKNKMIEMPFPLESSVFIIEDGKIWKGTFEKFTILDKDNIWLEVRMPKEMPDIVSIEYFFNEVGERVFASKEDAQNALSKAKRSETIEETR